ncbi:MAG: AIPR family protein [Candidatus Methanomethylophilaceae archaeon]|nr:AIPR family protein [Candidatus Methanomethylophilaceae archaeon]
MYDIESFRRQYIENIKADASAAGVPPAEEYLVAATKDMAAFDVCPEAEPCFYTGTGRHNRSVAVHGFAYTDGAGALGDRTLSLFVCDFSGEPDPPRMTEREFNDHSKRCIAFIEEAVDGQIKADGPGAKLARLIREGYEGFDRVSVYVVTDRIRSSRLKEVKDRDLGGKTVFFRLIDMEYIADTLKSSRPDDDSVIRVSDFGFSAIPCVKAGSSDTCTSYIGAVPGMFLALIYRDYGSRLLESNVRSFLTGKTKVNKGIRDTIREQPEMFFAYNNGVALTASAIEMGERGITSFTNLQIVNGGQTTVSLFKALKAMYKENLSEVFVPMKLVVVPSEDAFDIVRSISVFVNTQNAVRESDLTSSSRFQMAMEEASHGCSIPGSGSRWYYERTRGQFEQDSAKGDEQERSAFKKTYDRKRKMDKIDFAKYRCMLELKPDVVSRGGQTCYSLFSRDVSKAFSESPQVFGDDYFKETVAAALLYESVYDAVGAEDWFDGYLRPQISCYAVSKTVSDLSKAGRVLDFEEMWASQTVPKAVTEHALGEAESFFEHLKRISDAGGNAAQECRKPSCWESFAQMPAGIGSDLEACCPAAGKAKAAKEAPHNAADESVYALKAFNDWRKVKLLMMRESADQKEIAIIEDVLEYLKDPSSRRISPSRARQALEIRKRYV